MSNGKQIGKRLRSLRKKEMMTIASVADLLGIAPSTLTSYELGVRIPRDKIKKKIANYYGKTFESIFFK